MGVIRPPGASDMPIEAELETHEGSLSEISPTVETAPMASEISSIGKLSVKLSNSTKSF